MTQAVTGKQDIKLIPARLDVATMKTQLAIACVCSMLAAIAAYLPACGVGFIGNDFAVLHSAVAATEGGASAFFLSLNDASLISLGYGPLALLWLMLAQLICGIQPVFYHVLNICLLAVCTMLAVLLGSQVCSRGASWLAPGAGLWAGLLYAVHPSHVPVVASAAGSAELLCELLCLGAVFCYVRSRCLKERSYLALAITFFAASVFVKVQACTLPLIIALCELLLLWRERESVFNRMVTIAGFFAAIAVVLGALFFCPWHLPVSVLNVKPEDLFKLPASFLTWQTLFVLPEELRASPLTVLTLSAYAGMLALLVARLVMRTADWTPLVWLLSWLILSMVADTSLTTLPLVAIERDLLFATAPLCIFAAVACLPSIDAIDRRFARRFSAMGTAVLVALFGCYATHSYQLIQHWAGMSAETQAILNAVRATSERLPSGKGVLVAELPEELLGQDWVHFAFWSPFPGLHRVIQSVPPRVLEGGAVWPQLLVSAVQAANCGALLRWDAQNGAAVEWLRPEGIAEASVSLANRSIQGSQPQTIWLDLPTVSPLRADVACIDMSYSGAPDIPPGQIQVIWEAGTKRGAQLQKGKAAVFYHDGNRYLVWLGRYPNWSLNNSIFRVGLQFQPGKYTVELHSLKLVNHQSYMPEFSLNLSGKPTPVSPWPVIFSRDAAPTLKFDVTKIPDAAGTLIAIWDERARFGGVPEGQLYDINPVGNLRSEFHGNFIVRSDAAILSPELFRQPGFYYARAMAIDKNDKPFGLPTEPIAFRFKRQ